MLVLRSSAQAPFHFVEVRREIGSAGLDGPVSEYNCLKSVSGPGQREGKPGGA